MVPDLAIFKFLLGYFPERVNFVALKLKVVAFFTLCTSQSHISVHQHGHVPSRQAIQKKSSTPWSRSSSIPRTLSRSCSTVTSPPCVAEQQQQHHLFREHLYRARQRARVYQRHEHRNRTHTSPRAAWPPFSVLSLPFLSLPFLSLPFFGAPPFSRKSKSIVNRLGAFCRSDSLPGLKARPQQSKCCRFTGMPS